MQLCDIRIGVPWRFEVVNDENVSPGINLYSFLCFHPLFQAKILVQESSGPFGDQLDGIANNVFGEKMEL